MKAFFTTVNIIVIAMIDKINTIMKGIFEA